MHACCMCIHFFCFGRILSRIGTGQFGSVSMATWSSEGGVIEVAVKILTDSSNTVRFLQEAAIMAQFRHPNILALYMELSVLETQYICLYKELPVLYTGLMYFLINA